MGRLFYLLLVLVAGALALPKVFSGSACSLRRWLRSLSPSLFRRLATVGTWPVIVLCDAAAVNGLWWPQVGRVISQHCNSGTDIVAAHMGLHMGQYHGVSRCVGLDSNFSRRNDLIAECLLLTSSPPCHNTFSPCCRWHVCSPAQECRALCMGEWACAICGTNGFPLATRVCMVERVSLWARASMLNI